MSEQSHSVLVEEVIRTNRYLTLATADEKSVWVAPLEYLVDEKLNFYFLSLPSSQHARHLAENDIVALAIFDREQADYSHELSAPLRGVQIEARAWLLEEKDYPEAVIAAIKALQPPMPPYEMFKIEPIRLHLPIIEDGINKRIEVDMHL